jgi:hypothetical protein
MTKTQLKAAKAELKRINDFIAKHELGAGGFEITENVVNTKAHGERYVFVKLDKDDLKLRKQLKGIRYGEQGRGKARWNREAMLWSIKASALDGTVFGS